ATQAAHYLISQTDILDAGTTAYNYTPALDYVGTDAVQIKIGGGEMGMHKEHHPKDSIPHKEPLIKLPKLFHAHHSCNKDSVYVYNITFKIAKTTEIAPLAK
ncbi:MAG: hypothetical protein NTX03_01250, partial [Bacteroidetes bacterium]|nr:hypothetical protein [Bacteroidota bacterium]